MITITSFSSSHINVYENCVVSVMAVIRVIIVHFKNIKTPSHSTGSCSKESNVAVNMNTSETSSQCLSLRTSLLYYIPLHYYYFFFYKNFVYKIYYVC